MNALEPNPAQLEQRIIDAAQTGLPLVVRPYQELAERLGLSEREVIQHMQSMIERGAIRRIGVVPNHYALGITANGMSVWDIADERVTDIGRMFGSLSYVTHCYRRPRHQPIWRYNLFAMVHGRSRDEVLSLVKDMAELAKADCRGHDVIFSRRILKKTGLRTG